MTLFLSRTARRRKAKKPDIIKSAAQNVQDDFEKLSHAQEQLKHRNKRAHRNDNNPRNSRATRQAHTSASASRAVAQGAMLPQ
jgi:hypothetical protein